MAEMTVEQALAEAMRQHQAGNLAQAEAIYRRILALQPNHPDALHLSGMTAFQMGRADQGLQRIGRAITLHPAAEYYANLGVIFSAQNRLPEAIAACRRALELNPTLAQANNCIGNALVDLGHIDQALDQYRRALAIRPDYAEAWNNLGTTLSRTGQQNDALAAIRKAITLRPAYPEAHNNLAIVLKETGQFDAAIDSYRLALQYRPQYPEALSNLASTLNEKSRYDDAIVACQQAIALRPDFAEACNNLGSALRGAKKIPQAMAAYARALAINPNLAQAHNNLGNALQDQGRLDEAIECYNRAIAIRPNYPDALCHLGLALRDKGNADEAVVLLRRAVAIQPDHIHAWNNLGVALHDRGDTDEMIASFQRVIELKPDSVDAHNNMGIALKVAGRVDEALQSYERALRLNPDDLLSSSNRLYTLHNHPATDPADIFRQHCQWDAHHAQPLQRFIRPHANDRSPDRRLRIGYVSPDLRRHSVAFFLVPLLESHDPSAFHVTCYSTGAKVDFVTERIRQNCDTWRDLLGRSDEEAAEIIRADAIDILFDLSGHTSRNRLLMFARRPAPIQVTYLGYPSTTGLEAMDWRLTDEIADPPGAEEFYSEKIWRLPRTAWCYAPISGSPPIVPTDHAHVVFGSFNDMSKVNTPLLRIWARLLSQVPDSRLLIKNRATGSPDVRGRLSTELASLGIAADRLDFLPPDPVSEDHLSCYNRMDIALDTYPYHGTTTTCEALWMGVPVVTLAGKTHVSRVSASLLHSVGLDDLVAATEDDYIRIATGLAANPLRRQSLRSTLRPTMQASPLMDSPAAARDFESALRQMWRQWITQ